ncbi:hypothetical protein NHX12_012366, partial [Muraenolepis orangiensis]
YSTVSTDSTRPRSKLSGRRPSYAEAYSPAVYYRALVNFTNSLVYSPELEDIFSTAFTEVSDAVVDTTVGVVLIKKVIREDGVDVFVELDVGSDYNSDDDQIRSMLYSVVKEGAIASYVTSVQGFVFRRLGKVVPNIRPCMDDEHRCGDGSCILREYLCDNRPDCRDMSDEIDCGDPEGPCRVDQARCQSGECIPRDYLCDGERDCFDGSDEIRCGTPSPCEPNEFKCKNGRCALKLWRCDGDNDCEDNSDETDCPTKSPGDTCAPEQFVCLSDRTCIPASYQCDEEPDCPDRSDEYGCTPPSVTIPPQESVSAARGETVTLSCQAVGVPTPIITWRLNWGHIPTSGRVTMSSKDGHGTLTIRDVKEADQGAYTCEAINAKGLVFGIPDGVLTLTKGGSGNCPNGHFSVEGRCVSCFCSGITKTCQGTGRYRNRITLRFNQEDNYRGVNVTYPSRPGTPPLSSTQLLINSEMEEFQLVDLSRRFLILDSYWTLPRQFLGNKIDSYGGSLKYKVRYTLARGLTEPEEKPDVILVGNGRRLVYRRGNPTPARIVNQKEIKFTEDHWQQSNGRSVSREELLMTLANLDTINIRTVYDNHMVSVALSDIIMDTTHVEFSTHGHAKDVEECPAGYTGLSCEICSAGFERVPGGSYLGTCAGCNCNGHASACDPISGNCLSCQHHTEGPQCDKCRTGYFGEPSRGRHDDCRPCPCPYTETSRRFSDTCFLETDQQATCDACRPGYTGRRCENRPCSCKNNVAGAQCDQCKPGSFHLSEGNVEGCMQCFCMGVTKQCASSSWSRDQVRGGTNGQLFSLTNLAQTRGTSDDLDQNGSEVVFRSFASLPSDTYYWLLPESFLGDKLTYSVHYEPRQRSLVIDGQPDVVIQGNGISLEHHSQSRVSPRTPTTVVVTFREPCTREHLLMALADVTVFMIRATYADSMAESSISDIKMDIAVPHSTGHMRALEECDEGYTRTGSGLYLGTCESCDCHGHASSCDPDTGACLPCVRWSSSLPGLPLPWIPLRQPAFQTLLLRFSLYALLEGELEDFLPVGCGAEAVFNYSLDEGIPPDSSGDDDWEGEGSGGDGKDPLKPVTTTTEPPSTGTAFSVPNRTSRYRTTRAVATDPTTPWTVATDPTTPWVDATDPTTPWVNATDPTTPLAVVPIAGGRWVPRLRPRVTVSPEERHASFQQLLRLHLNTFNHRLSMLESNTLDMKDGIRAMTEQQVRLSAQLERLLVPGPAPERQLEKAEELELSYGGMETRLSRLEGRLEILIDGFTALAQEMNKMKRSRHSSRSVQEHPGATPLVITRPGLPPAPVTQDRKRTRTAATVSARLPAKKLTAVTRSKVVTKPAAKSKSTPNVLLVLLATRSLDRDVLRAMNVEGSSCSNCKSGTFHLSPDNRDGCLSCFCMGVTQQCSSSTYYRDLVSSVFSPGNFQDYALVNRQRTNRISSGFSVEVSTDGTQLSYSNFDYLNQEPHYWQLPGAYQGDKYAVVYRGFGPHQDEPLYWLLPALFTGDKVVAYGAKLRYTISYVAGSRGTFLDDADVQIIGNDITLVARQPWQRRQQGGRESKRFEIVFREENWQRPDGMPATREHLMMVLADLDDVLIRASYSSEMRSSSISEVSMEVAVPNYSGLAQALEVEQCRCPPGYQGLSCQDCSAGYTRTGGGLYLGHCELCECNGHSDSCHPETGICTNCLHNTQGELCEQCAVGSFGDPTVGTPEDCQPCACPHTDPDNQFSPTCESLGNGGYQCTACQPGYTGQYCERCALGYVGRPQERVKCRPYDDAASLVVKVYPERVLMSQGGAVTLRCQVSGTPPHYFFWTREDGRLVSRNADRRRNGVYVCTCRDQRSSNKSRAEIVVTAESSKPIEVTVEQPQSQSSPAYTLVWTRKGNGKLPNRAMDFNGILTIQNVRPEDAGVYICTGSNMFAMDEGNAALFVIAAEGVQPVATVSPSVLTVQPGQRAEFRCTAAGSPAPAIEWLQNRQGSPATVQGAVLSFASVQKSDEGEYVCKALNTHGEHTARVTLYVQKSTHNTAGLASQPQVQVSPPNAEIREGETLRLYCRVSGSPTPKLTWLRNGGQIPAQAIPSHGFHQFKSNSLDVLQRRIEEMQSRMGRTDIGTLVIPNAKMSDSGSYTCIGINGAGSNKASIQVTVRKGAHVTSPVSIQPSIADVQEGQSLELSCLATGNPPPRVTWTRASGRLSSNHQVSGNQLRIVSASPEDSGDYICQVVSNHGNQGSPVHRASVSVSVTSSTSRLQTPIISIEPHSASVRLGASASFKCRVYSGAQPVRLEWKMSNNRPLPANTKISRDGSVITIANAQSNNRGAYHCVASNLFGITQSIVSLNVRESPVGTVTPSGPVRVRVGDPIILECQSSGEPRPAVSWHRLDSSRKTMLSSPVPMDSNAVLEVPELCSVPPESTRYLVLSARPEDGGTYVCTARNSEGTSETQVEVVVEGGARLPSVPRASVPEPLMIVEEGQTATLRCNAHGFPTPRISWSKLRSPLPWRHTVVNGSLVLPSVGRQDSGEYICNATNHLGVSEVIVTLDVETVPYATAMPDDVAVRVGEVIRLQCLAHGTPPLQYTWNKVEGSLPSRAEVTDGDLQINLAAPEDAGGYRCTVVNRMGRSEAVAKVTVRWGAETLIEWLREGLGLPPNHHIKDGVLRIENLVQSDEGIYICRAISGYGQAQDSAKLTIQALPKVMINVRTSIQTVMVGNGVEFECQAIGDPQPTVRWSKVGGTLPDHVAVKDGILRIRQVMEADAGEYRCTATNDVGSVQSQVVLSVQSLPQISALPETKEVTLGSDAVMPCAASGYPEPKIRWSKMGEDLPAKCFQVLNVLTVPRVSQEDSGTYVCTASNKQGKVEAFTSLQVHERVMPYFAQEPLSYLSLPTIKNAYKAFTIRITFRPDNVDGVILYAGMIVYNGQRRSTGADFMSLGLVGGRLEFRFDVGSGMATIRDPNPLKLGEFHTVELYRNLTLGSLSVDGGDAINGSSQGKFQGLDLNEELHVGGYPNYTLIHKTAGIKSGFVGCIRQLIIQDEEVIFKDLHRSSTGVTNCPTCKDQPCQNGGQCAVSETSLYKCGCPEGFTGSNCQHHSALHCHIDACGPDATCINRPSGLGYDCRCHLGKSGNKCMGGELVTTPVFDGEASYIAYPPLTNIHDDLRVELEFKPLERDGLMFFCGGKKMKVEDFVAVSMVDGHVELRYELGTGQAILRSPEPVSLGQWHRVVAERNMREGHLSVDQGSVERKTSPGKAQGLNIHTPMYLGGVPDLDLLPKPANISHMFKGCVGEVSINNKTVDLSYSFTESRGVRRCVDDNPCDRRPCLNKGHCMANAEYEYQCLCQDGFGGEHCEVARVVCQSSLQCHNGGSCVEGRCVCTEGHGGLHCDADSPYQYAAQFHNDGAQDTPETMEMEILTTSPEGLVLWQGVELGDKGKGKDFISLGLRGGHLVFSYQLGSGEAEIKSWEPINDGQWHKVTAVRTGKEGYIQIDGGDMRHGQSKGKSLMVNTKGSIYLGGAPDTVGMTDGRFSGGMRGCVRNVSLMSATPGARPAQAIDLQAHASQGVNVHPCSS